VLVLVVVVVVVVVINYQLEGELLDVLQVDRGSALVGG
jgi:hypothetical protein